MRKILYSKYNRTRVPSFQTATRIVEDNGTRYVEKYALLPEAQQHVDNMVQYYERLKKAYKNVKPCPCVMDSGIVRFDYLEGQSVSEIIKTHMSSIEETIEIIGGFIDSIFSYSDDAIIPFMVTDKFTELFGSYDGIGGIEGQNAVLGADIDINFENVISVGKNLYCIDYEWYLDCAIPVKLIMYRTLHYFYENNESYFSNYFEEEEFLEKFGIKSDEKELYRYLDRSFQQIIHGTNWRNVYTARYEKKLIMLKDCMHKYKDELFSSEYHLSNQQADNEAQLKNQLDMYEARYNEITSSLSWKVTAPLRMGGNAINALRRKDNVVNHDKEDEMTGGESNE